MSCLVNGDSVDDERGFEAIEENLPKVQRLLCHGSNADRTGPDGPGCDDCDFGRVTCADRLKPAQLKETTIHQDMSHDSYHNLKLGDFYVSSPLLFRNILFCTSPVMPVIFMLHEA